MQFFERSQVNVTKSNQKDFFHNDKKQKKKAYTTKPKEGRLG